MYGIKTLSIDLYELPFEQANSVKKIEQLLVTIAEALQYQILKQTFHTFLPQGITGFLLLSESHLAVHTWPEKKYAHLTLVTCKPFEQAQTQLLHTILKEFTSKSTVQEITSWPSPLPSKH